MKKIKIKTRPFVLVSPAPNPIFNQRKIFGFANIDQYLFDIIEITSMTNDELTCRVKTGEYFKINKQSLKKTLSRIDKSKIDFINEIEYFLK